MGNHTTEVCGKRKHTQNDPNIDITNTSRNYKRTCYRSGLSGHFKFDCIHFKRAPDQCNKVNKGPASTSIDRERDCNLIREAQNAIALTSDTAPAAWVINTGAAHHMCNDRTRFNTMKKLYQPIVIELGDDNKGTVSHHGLVNFSQE